MSTKTKRIELRLSESESKALEKLAEKSRLSNSEVIRRLIKDCRICEAPPVDYYNLIVELRNVGSRINQILNTAIIQNSVDIEYLKNTIESYRKTEHMIWEAFSPEKMK